MSRLPKSAVVGMPRRYRFEARTGTTFGFFRTARFARLPVCVGPVTPWPGPTGYWRSWARTGGLAVSFFGRGFYLARADWTTEAP